MILKQDSIALLSCKDIKKWSKILLIVTLCLCGIGVVGYYLLITKPVQNLVGQQILNRLSDKTGTTIQASKVSFAHFKDLKIKDLYIEDKKGDTLIFAPLAIAHLDSLSTGLRFAVLDQLQLKQAIINIAQYNDSSYNFSFLIDSLYQADIPNSQRWNVKFGAIDLKKSTISAVSQHQDTIAFDNFSTRVHLNDQTVDVQDLSFQMRNGFKLSHSELLLKIDSQKIQVPELSMYTPHSSLILRNISIQSLHNSLKHTPFALWKIHLSSNQSYISSQDIEYFIEDKGIKSTDIVIDGKLSGNMEYMEGEELCFKSKDLFDFKGNFILYNLLSKNDFRYAIEIDTFKTYVENSINLYNQLSHQSIDVSEYAHWDELAYSGSLRGNLSLINLSGHLTSKYGDIHPSILLHLSDSSRGFSYNGDVSIPDFDLHGALNTTNALGRFSSELHVQGGMVDGALLHYYLAEIPYFEYNDYRYHKIEIEGILDTNYVNTVVSIDDPNAFVNFSGELNFKREKPEYIFSLMMSRIDLAATHFMKEYDQFEVFFDSYVQLEGQNIDDLNGYADLFQVGVKTEFGEFNTDSLHFTFKPLDAMPSIDLKSDYINAQLLGSYNFAELPGYINQALGGHLRHLPILFDKPNNKTPNNFHFEFEIEDLYQLAEAIDFPITANGKTQVEGRINSKMNTFELAIDMPYLMTDYQIIDSIALTVHQDYTGLQTQVYAQQIAYIGDHMIKDVEVESILQNDTLSLDVKWKDKSQNQTVADFHSNIFILPYGKELMSVLAIKPSTFILSDTPWLMDSATITLIKDRVTVDNFSLRSGVSHLLVDGIYSKQEDDSLFFDLNRFDLAYLDQFLKIKNTQFSGLMSGEAVLYQQNERLATNAKITIDSTRFNQADWGKLALNSKWDNRIDALDFDIVAHQDSTKTMDLRGLYYAGNDSLSAQANFAGFGIDFLRPYLEHTLDSLYGEMHGQLDVRGALASPQLYGAVDVDKGQFRIDYLSTDYTINDSIYFDNNQFIFNDTKVLDQENNVALVKGTVIHEGYRDMLVDLQLKSDRFLALNNSAAENEYFFGDIYYGGLVTITSDDNETRISSSASTMSGSELTVPLSPVSVANTNNFIRYRTTQKQEKVVNRRKLLSLEPVYEPKRKLVIDLDFEVTEDALVRLEFNSESGDIIRGQGNGDLKIQFEHGQPFQMFGEYEISKGEYQFSLQQLFTKRFDIIAGSTMRWSGAPGDAVMDITGRYNTKASLYNLMPDAIGEANKNRRVPVNVKLMLQGLLSQPDIIFDIELPSTNEQTQQSVSGLINTEEEMSRQVLSLLIMNSFYTPEYYTDASSAGAQTNNQISNVAAVTASEFLSKQLSNWVSQIYSNVDLGLYYVPGQELSDQGMSPQEYEMAISSQFFNDRLIINSNFGYQDYSNSAGANLDNNFIGEVDLELKLNNKLRLKAYSHQNEDILYESSTLKQGVGISYQEDFESLGELEKRYKENLRKLFTQKDKRNSEATERKDEEMVDEKE